MSLIDMLYFTNRVFRFGNEKLPSHPKIEDGIYAHSPQIHLDQAVCPFDSFISALGVSNKSPSQSN